MLKDAVDEIPEDSPEKQTRLQNMINDEGEGDYLKQSRWIGIMEKYIAF